MARRLRQRIEQGKGALVFAPANTEHPQRLAALRGCQAAQVFGRNSLCALTAAPISASPDTLRATLLRPRPSGTGRSRMTIRVEA